jgi:hypothetical protein
MVSPYLKNKGSAVRFCLWPLMIHKFFMLIVKTILNFYNRKNINADLLFVKEVNRYSNFLAVNNKHL